MIYEVDLHISLVLAVHEKPFAIIALCLIFMILDVNEQISLVLMVHNIDFDISLVLMVSGIDFLRMEARCRRQRDG